MDDYTIVQLSTPRINSAIHIIRFSGDRSLFFLKEHTRLTNIIPRQVYTCLLYYGDEVIDNLLCFYFSSPNSYTGEDMVELHVHGSLSIVDVILKIAIHEGCRLARPGEFTYRAFVNGKISLEQAEAVDSLIRSKNHLQRKNALQILQERVSFRFSDLKDKLGMMLASLESAIEFPEEDIPEITHDRKSLYRGYHDNLETIIKYFKEILNNYRKGKKIADGVKVMIIGSPNSGKSTLFNTLLKDNRSIISPYSGTTRDYVTEDWEIDLQDNIAENNSDVRDEISLFKETVTVKLYDTAGIHDSPGELEQIGMDRLPDLIKEVDLVIWLISGLDCYNHFIDTQLGKTMIRANENRGEEDMASHQLSIFLNKMDVLSAKQITDIELRLQKDGQVLSGRFSLKENPQMAYQHLEKHIRDWIQSKYFYESDSLALLNQRQGDISEKILEQLYVTQEKIYHLESEEILVEDIRQLDDYLGELDLQHTQEEIYQSLFGRFCIGK